MVTHRATAELREDAGGCRPYSIRIGFDWARTESGAIRTFATKRAAKIAADNINLIAADKASMEYIAPGISVQSVAVDTETRDAQIAAYFAKQTE
jgi:hypothetical protein